MKKFFPFLLLFITSFAFLADKIHVSTKEFKPVFGKWKGSLTYLDYKTGKPYTMPVNVDIFENTTNDNQFIIGYNYPNEPKANENDTLTIRHHLINKSKVISKKILPNKTVEIITEINGKDGNDDKNAILKHTYIIGNNIFSIRKDVQFVGDTTWIQRNIYLFKR